MSSVGTSKGVLEVAKFALYVAIPVGLMYTFANNSKNLDWIIRNNVLKEIMSKLNDAGQVSCGGEMVEVKEGIRNVEREQEMQGRCRHLWSLYQGGSTRVWTGWRRAPKDHTKSSWRWHQAKGSSFTAILFDNSKSTSLFSLKFKPFYRCTICILEERNQTSIGHLLKHGTNLQYSPTKHKSRSLLK